jgi:hypothetical protein
MLQPTIRKAWAPRGQTPILKCYDQRDRLTVVSALSISPQRRRLGVLSISSTTISRSSTSISLSPGRCARFAGPSPLSSTGTALIEAMRDPCERGMALDSRSSDIRRTPRNSILRNTCGGTRRTVIPPTSFPTMCFLLDERSPRDSERQETINPLLRSFFTTSKLPLQSVSGFFKAQ